MEVISSQTMIALPCNNTEEIFILNIKYYKCYMLLISFNL